MICTLLVMLTACGDNRSPAEKMAATMEDALAGVQTVAGQLEISTGPVTLQQELWVQRPNFLRTETEDGPAAFKGTIVVLNDKDGWFYNPALNMVTLTNRSQFDPAQAEAAATGSLLERIPDDIVALLRTNPAINEIGREVMAGRSATHLEIISNGQIQAFPAGLLQLWLDEEYGYPLALTMSSGLEIRFTSIQFNRPIDPLTFVFVPPPGALVQRVE